MTGDLKLHPSNSCPACGEPGILWPGGEEKCDACTGTFRDQQRVRYNHRLGTLHALTLQEACDELCSRHDLHEDTDPGAYFGRKIDEFAEQHFRFEYDPEHLPWNSKRLGRTNLHTILKKDDPGLVHAKRWEPPELGPDHPDFEDTLDIIRSFGAARATTVVAEANLVEAREREREAWKRVRPALKALIEKAGVDAG